MWSSLLISLPYRCRPLFLQAHIVLDLTADLRSVFSWNTKQLFVYVNIDFATPKNPESHMVMWSTLVVRKDDALLVKPHLRASYPYAVTDQGSNLIGRGFNVTVAWNVMPRVGALYTDSETFSGERVFVCLRPDLRRWLHASVVIWAEHDAVPCVALHLQASPCPVNTSS